MISVWYILLTSLLSPPINKRGNRIKRGGHVLVHTSTNNRNNNWPVNSTLIPLTTTESMSRVSDEEAVPINDKKKKNKNKEIFNTVTIQELSSSSSTITTVEQFLISQGCKESKQFLSDNVERILIHKGSELNSAREAGEAVQSKAYERFLRLKLSSRSRRKTNIKNIVNGMEEEEEEDRGNKYYNIEGVIDVLTEAGLSGRDCAAILSHTPSVALMKARRTATDEVNEGNAINDLNTVEDTITCILTDVLSGLLSLRKYDARKVLRGCPGLITKKGAKGAVGCLQIFSAIGVSYNSLARDKTTLPYLLSRSPSSLFRFITFLSSGSIRMPIESIGPLLRKAETLPLLDAVCPTPFIAPHSGGNCDYKVRKYYDNMKQAVDVLSYQIGLESVHKVISAYPSVLLFNPNTQIIPVVQYLLNDMGLYDAEVAKVIESYPSLLNADVADIQNVIDYLLSLDVSPDPIVKIFRAFPSMFLLDVRHTIVPVVKYLGSIGIVNIARFITRLPPVLGYSVERELIPKWEYLKTVCEFHEFEIVRFPAYFSYPLDKVIMTRYDYLKQKGIPYKTMSVDTILRFGDVDFATSVACDRDAGRSFSVFKNTRRNKKQQGSSSSIRNSSSRKDLVPTTTTYNAISDLTDYV